MKKIFLSFLVLNLIFNAIYSQSSSFNLSGYDETKIHYGFLLGVHSSYYRLNYSDEFIGTAYKKLHSINPKSIPGFKLGFISDFNFL